MHDSADAAGTYIVYAFLSLLYQAKNFLKIVKVFFDIPYGTFDLGHIKYNFSGNGWDAIMILFAATESLLASLKSLPPPHKPGSHSILLRQL